MAVDRIKAVLESNDGWGYLLVPCRLSEAADPTRISLARNKSGIEGRDCWWTGKPANCSKKAAW